MKALHETSLVELLRRARALHLLTEHREVDQFIYLDVGTHRFIFTHEQARPFLLGLLARHAHEAALPAQAA